MQPKSKKVAGLFGIFLGAYGVHNFYLGYKNKAILQLVLTLAGSFTAPLFLIGLIPVFGVLIWSVVEGITILTSKEYRDAQGNLLV